MTKCKNCSDGEKNVASTNSWKAINFAYIGRHIFIYYTFVKFNIESAVAIFKQEKKYLYLGTHGPPSQSSGVSIPGFRSIHAPVTLKAHVLSTELRDMRLILCLCLETWFYNHKQVLMCLKQVLSLCPSYHATHVVYLMPCISVTVPPCIHPWE